MSSEKKHFNPFFLWVTAGLSILVIGAYFLKVWPFRTVETMELHRPAVNLLLKRENNPTVKEYIDYVQDDPEKMSLNHEFSNKALLKLSAAIKSMSSAAGYRLVNDLAAADAYANQITVDPLAVTHADDIIKSADILTEALTSLQQKKYPSLSDESGKLHKSADDIDPEVQTLDQRKKVKAFFTKAAALLEKMN
ncbi:hypothetical protein [Pedobacter endophyticus]|uniref:Uncharacterized protein n=1 Tax=Pedobacter endophyticus TaxID=2789740 RepID=A0A7U3Q4V3_9SPHI|nr:hypothetical protein [Pedobacter endophyticus]QPH38607.1 hypothetical protein IZT61_16190 [Pedobacter endophyticus]